MPTCAAVRSWAAARSSYWAGRSMVCSMSQKSAHKLRALSMHDHPLTGLEPPSVYGNGLAGNTRLGTLWAPAGFGHG